MRDPMLLDLAFLATVGLILCCLLAGRWLVARRFARGEGGGVGRSAAGTVRPTSAGITLVSAPIIPVPYLPTEPATPPPPVRLLLRVPDPDATLLMPRLLDRGYADYAQHGVHATCADHHRAGRHGAECGWDCRRKLHRGEGWS